MCVRFVLFLGACAMCGTLALGQDGILDTVAGTGIQGSSGNDGLASVASFSLILSVATRVSDGSQFVADAGANVVRRIGADGIITAFCGQSGQDGYDGDGGLATEAHINAPYDVAVDSNGNVFIAEAGNSIVRRVDATTGIITTFAGSGVYGYNAPNGVATTIELSIPAGLAVDASNNVYIADQKNGLVRKVDSDGYLTAVAGDFESKGASTGDGGAAELAGLNEPGGLAIGSDGSLYILEIYGHRVRRVAPDGIISTFAGTGEVGYFGDGSAATDAMFHFDDQEGAPSKLDFSSDGSLLIADVFNHAIRRVNSSCCIETFAGSGIAGYDGDGKWAFEGKLSLPYDVACLPNGDFTIADTNNFRLRQVNTGLVIPAGAGVTASLGDEVSITFDEVNTGIEISIDVRDPNDPAIPDNLQVNGQYLDFTLTNGTFVGTITLRIKYDPTGLTLEEQEALKLLHYNGTEWVDVTVSVDTSVTEIIGRVSSLSPFAVVRPISEVPLINFRRGETNGDKSYDVSDAVTILLFLFSGRPISCVDAVDVDDNGTTNISDAIHLLSWLFLSGPPPAPPGSGDSGLDPTADDLGCTAYPF